MARHTLKEQPSFVVCVLSSSNRALSRDPRLLLLSDGVVGCSAIRGGVCHQSSLTKGMSDGHGFYDFGMGSYHGLQAATQGPEYFPPGVYDCGLLHHQRLLNCVDGHLHGTRDTHIPHHSPFLKCNNTLIRREPNEFKSRPAVKSSRVSRVHGEPPTKRDACDTAQGERGLLSHHLTRPPRHGTHNGGEKRRKGVEVRSRTCQQGSCCVVVFGRLRRSRGGTTNLFPCKNRSHWGFLRPLARSFVSMRKSQSQEDRDKGHPPL
jgi:hypothetical protein